MLRMAKRLKNPAAVALGRLGAKACASTAGKARMAQLSPEERSAIGRKAIRARWATAKPPIKKPPLRAR